MNTKMKKIIFIILLVILFIGIISTQVYALDIKNDFDPSYSNTGEVKSVFKDIIGMVQIIGTGIAVVMLIVIAIKYLTAAPEGKADMKKSLIIYVVAAVILFSAVGLLNIIKNWSDKIGTTSSSSSSTSIIQVADITVRE